MTKKYGLSVEVTGAADSYTGTAIVNDPLSASSRAAYIAAELEPQYSCRLHNKSKQAGIAGYVPTETNHYTKVEFLWGNSRIMSE